MNEMKPILYRWQLAKYTTVTSFTFWKVSVKLYNFRVPVYKGVALPWMKWYYSMKWYSTFNNNCWASLRVWKFLLSEKWVLNYTTLALPFIRGFPSHEWNDSHPLTMTAGQVYQSENFTSWNVSVKLYNFRVPVYKGVSLPWMKWNPTFNDECWQSILVWKKSLSEKLVLIYTTLGFPFISGFPSHEWNDTILDDDC